MTYFDKFCRVFKTEIVTLQSIASLFVHKILRWDKKWIHSCIGPSIKVNVRQVVVVRIVFWYPRAPSRAYCVITGIIACLRISKTSNWFSAKVPNYREIDENSKQVLMAFLMLVERKEKLSLWLGRRVGVAAKRLWLGAARHDEISVSS